MLRPVEVLHEGHWVPATMMATRLEADGWYGLVACSDPLTRARCYAWCPKADLRGPPDGPPSSRPEPPPAAEPTTTTEPAERNMIDGSPPQAH